MVSPRPMLCSRPRGPLATLSGVGPPSESTCMRIQTNVPISPPIVSIECVVPIMPSIAPEQLVVPLSLHTSHYLTSTHEKVVRKGDGGVYNAQWKYNGEDGYTDNNKGEDIRKKVSDSVEKVSDSVRHDGRNSFLDESAEKAGHGAEDSFLDRLLEIEFVTWN